MGIRIFIGVALASVVGGLLAAFSTLPDPAIWTAVVTCVCAAWWVLQPIPIAATSIIPFVAFPLLGVASHKVVAHAYGHTLILLLMGGFILSKAVESVGAHRRIAIGMVRLTGGGGYRSTKYGAQFLPYLSRNRGGPRLVGCAG